MITGVFVGAGGMILLGLIVFTVIEPEFREALGQVLGVLIVGPVVIFRAALRRSPRAIRLSPRALERFVHSRQFDGLKGSPAWLLAYRGRGVILVRQSREQSYWENDMPNVAARIRRLTAQHDAPKVRPDRTAGETR